MPPRSYIEDMDRPTVLYILYNRRTFCLKMLHEMTPFLPKKYRMARNFGRKIFRRIAENMSFASLNHNDIHNKMASQTS